MWVGFKIVLVGGVRFFIAAQGDGGLTTPGPRVACPDAAVLARRDLPQAAPRPAGVRWARGHAGRRARCRRPQFARLTDQAGQAPAKLVPPSQTP